MHCGHWSPPRPWTMLTWRLGSHALCWLVSVLKFWQDLRYNPPGPSLSGSRGSVFSSQLPWFPPSTCQCFHMTLGRCRRRKSWSSPRLDTAPFGWLQDARRQKYREFPPPLACHRHSCYRGRRRGQSAHNHQWTSFSRSSWWGTTYLHWCPRRARSWVALVRPLLA